MSLEDYTNLDDDKFKSWVSSLDDTTRATLTGKTAFDQYRASLQSTGTLVERLKRSFQTLKSFFEIEKKSKVLTTDKKISKQSESFFDDYGKWATDKGETPETFSLQKALNIAKKRPNLDYGKEFNDFIDSLSDAEKKSLSLAEAYDLMTTKTQSVTKYTIKTTDAFKQFASDLGGKVKSVIGPLVSGLTNIGTSMLISWGIEKGIEAINNYIHRVEIAIEKGKEAQQAIADTKSELESKKVISTSAERFGELREGVNVETNDNISLTNEEYKEYIALCDQIADIHPELVTGYDEQGNALLNLAGNAEEATAKLLELYDIDAKIAGLEIAGNVQTVHEGIVAQIEELDEEREKLEWNYEQMLPSSIQSIENIRNGSWNAFNPGAENYNTFLDYLDDNNVDYTPDPSFHNVTFNKKSLKDRDHLSDILEAWTKTSDYSTNLELSTDRAQNLYEQSLIDKQKEALWQEDILNFIDGLSGNVNYGDFSDEVQAAINEAVGRLEFSEFTNDNGEFVMPTDYTDMNQWVEDNFIDPIAYAFTDLGTNDESLRAAQQKAQDAFTELFSLDTSILNVTEYESMVSEYLDQLKPLFDRVYGDESDTKFSEFKLRFGFKVVDEYGNEVDSNRKIRHDLVTLAEQNKEDLSGITEMLDTLTVDQLIEVNTIYTDPSNGQTLPEVVEQVTAETQEIIESEPIKFSSLFTSDDSEINSKIDTFQSATASIKSSLDSLRAGEPVDLTDLIQEFPELIGQTGNLESALSKLQLNKLKEFGLGWQDITSGFSKEEIANASEVFSSIMDSVDLSGFDLANYRDYVMSNLTELGDIHYSPMDTWSRMMSKYGTTDEGREMLIKLSADPNNVYKTFEELDETAQSMLLEISINAADTGSVLSQISTINDKISGLATGSTIDIEFFNTQEYEDYKSALEWVNGSLKLNSDRVRELNKAKADEQIATNEAKKAQEQQKYVENAKEIHDLQLELRDLEEGSLDYTSTLSRLKELQGDNSDIVSRCQQLDAYNAALRKSIGEYEAWKIAQNEPESGDVFDDTKTMWEQIREVSDSESENYGKVGTEKYQAAVDFLVPETVDHTDQQAVSDYLDSISKYLTFEDGQVKGLDLKDFVEDAMSKGLMYFDEESETYKIAGEKTMQDFVDGMGLALPFVEAIFGELEEYLPEGNELVWSDSEKSMGDLAVAAGEAVNAFSALAGYENVDIQIDVSDYATTEEKVSALNDTITQMSSVLGVVNIDSAEAENARAIMEYCIAQIQQLTAPVVMQVDASSIQDETVSNAITSLQSLVTAQNTLEANLTLGYDTTQAEADVSAALESIKTQSDTMLSLGLKVDENTSAQSLIDQMMAQTEEPYVNIGADIKPAQDAIADINNDAVKDKEFDVKANDYATDKLNSIIESLNKIKSKTIEVRVNRTTSNSSDDGKPQSVNGTAHVNGKYSRSINRKIGRAYLNGNWGTKKSGTTLVGELGQEIVVDPNTGKWYTVGDNGAEFVDIPKNAIVFNHIQSQELLENGYVTSRGDALAGGNAFVTKGDEVSNGGWKLETVQKVTDKNIDNSKATNKNTSAINAQTKATEDNTDTAKETKETFDDFISKFKDWIEVLIQREEESKNLNLTISDNKAKAVDKNTYVDKALIDVGDLIDANKTGVAKYKAQATKVKNKAVSKGLVSKKEANQIVKKIKNGDINILDYDEDARKFIDSYSEWYDKAMQCKQAVQDLKLEQKELAQQKFDNIVTEFDNIIGRIEHDANLINISMDEQELKGHLTSTKYYDALSANTQSSINEMEKKRVEMQKSLQESMDAGIIKEGSVEWHEMQGQIDEVTESIEEAKNQLIEYGNSAREALWAVEDMKHESVNRLTAESDFFIDLMSSDKLFDDKGNVTSQGKATSGLTMMNYNTALSEAQKYEKEWRETQDQIDALGEDYDINLINRANDLRDKWMGASSAANQYAQAIKDLKDQEFQAQLDSLQKLSDKYMEVLNKQKDMYDYQNEVSDQTAEISRLEKLQMAYANDTSEEGRLKRQQVENDLEEARKNLEETQYDKYISDQQEILDSIYAKTEEFFQQRLDNVDQLLEEATFNANANKDQILDTLKAEGDAVAYDPTTEMESIWGKDGSVLTTFTNDFADKSTSVLTVLGTIRDGVAKMAGISDREADKDLKDTDPPKKGSEGKNPGNNDTIDGGPTVSENGNTVAIKKKKDGSSLADEITSDLFGNNPIKELLTLGVSDKKTIEKEKKKKHSDLWKYIVDNYGHIPTREIFANLGRLLGVQSEDSYTSKKDKNKLLKALKAKGYKRGTDYLDKDRWTMTQEDGREIIALPDGSILAPLGRGSGVINNAKTEQILSLANNHDAIMDMMNTTNKLNQAKQAEQIQECVKAICGLTEQMNHSMTSGVATYNGTTININLPGVQKPEDFMNWLRNNTRAQHDLQDVVFSEVMGRGKLSTRKK